MPIYIGSACTFHDSALAVIDESGGVLFAEATERFLQNKRSFNCPPDDINRIGELLDRFVPAGASTVILSRSWSQELKKKGFDLYRRLHKFISKAHPRHEDGEKLVRAYWRYVQESNTRSVDRPEINLQLRLAELRPDTRLELRHFDHHACHAATGCYTSPFEDAVCAVLDGYGEGIAYSYFELVDGGLRPLETEVGLGSLGAFYSQLCLACGFDPHRGEEWKVMGLAAHGEVRPDLYELLRGMIVVEDTALHLPTDFLARAGELISRRRPGSSPPREAADLAASGQQAFEDITFDLLTNLARHTDSRNLVLSGGCALNSSCNGQILARTPFENLHVFSAPADDGNAIGAALLARLQDTGGAADPTLHSPFLGSSTNQQTLERMLQIGGLEDRSKPGVPTAVQVAELLAAGKVVGWMQGQAEFGPRALGNRSILADPRDPSIKETLNARVKFREEFRPFAPSILHEFGAEYFEDYQESPYMERTLRFRPEAAEKVPGVVHVNGTGRLQSVRREWNPRYYDLIRAFYERTGVPVVLNTSFNVMGKPIVHAVEDAVAMFFTTGLDALVIEDRMFVKDG